MATVPCEEIAGAVRGAKVGLLTNGTFWVEHAGDDITGIVRHACRELVVLYGEHGPLGYEWKFDYWLRSVRAGGWKLIQRYDASGLTGRELYRVDRDPGELEDLWDRHGSDPEIAALDERLAGFIRDGNRHNPGFRARQGAPMSDEMKESLRALGYID